MLLQSIRSAYAHSQQQILGSAYLLGASHEHLNDIYDHDSKELEHWRDSPGEVSKYDWRDYLGNRRSDTPGPAQNLAMLKYH